MGIGVNALSVAAGSFLGSFFRGRQIFKNFTVLGISIMIISLVGFFENIFDVSGISLKSDALLVVVYALILGTVLGDALQLEKRLAGYALAHNERLSALGDATVFFGVGGLQICGAILLATTGDSSQLLLKSMIDFPFALMFGISYGKRIALAALPVAAGQGIIFLLAFFVKDFFNAVLIKQLCAMGYIILFFSGFNLLCEEKYKVNNMNMIFGILILLLYHFIKNLWGNLI